MHQAKRLEAGAGTISYKRDLRLAPARDQVVPAWRYHAPARRCRAALDEPASRHPHSCRSAPALQLSVYRVDGHRDYQKCRSRNARSSLARFEDLTSPTPLTVMQYLHRETAILAVYVFTAGQYALRDAYRDRLVDPVVAVRRIELTPLTKE